MVFCQVSSFRLRTIHTFALMSDKLNHECGIAMVRLLKPLTYYQKKYNTSFYGLNKLYSPNGKAA
jgi:hypothetical protein